MIVIESGGTKSTWMFLDNQGAIQKIASVGLHPREINDDKNVVIRQLIEEYQLQNREIYFYGAGCESIEAKEAITTFLSEKSLLVKIVETDIYGACLSHLGNREGVVGIIGTGAVAAQYDGNKVTKITSGWGYILGDEGSGFDLGKRLLQLHLGGKLSNEISQDILEYFNHKAILHRVYAPDGRRFVAGLTKIISKHKDTAIIADLIQSAFSDFCDTALSDLDIKDKVHFIGSVAYYFSKELEIALNNKGYQLGNIHQEAIDGIFEFLDK